MKRLLLVLLIASLFFPSCRPLMEWIGEDVGNTQSATWYVKNLTNTPVRVLTAYMLDSRLIEQGDSTAVNHFRPHISDGIPSFESLYNRRDTNSQVIRIDIMSPDGELLRTWKSSERHLPGRQFFSEAYWRRYEERSIYSPSVDVTWVFDILPEDIAPAKPEP